MKTKYEIIKFDTHQKEIVVALIEQHVAEVNSLFWLNVEPDVHGKDIHTGSIFWKAFSSRGPVIPKFTWVSASISKSGNYQQAQLGLTHPTGNAVLQRLRDFNLTVSDDWMLSKIIRNEVWCFNCQGSTMLEKLLILGFLLFQFLAHLSVTINSVFIIR